MVLIFSIGNNDAKVSFEHVRQWPDSLLLSEPGGGHHMVGAHVRHCDPCGLTMDVGAQKELVVGHDDK